MQFLEKMAKIELKTWLNVDLSIFSSYMKLQKQAYDSTIFATSNYYFN